VTLVDPERAPLPELLGAVDQAVRSGDLLRASELAEAALGRGVEHPGLSHLAGWRLHQQGRYEAALERLQRANALAPDDADILNSLGLCLNRLGRASEADRAYHAALARRPAFPQAWYNKGAALRDAGMLEEAQRCFERAVELSPGYAEPLAALAASAAQRRDLEQARTLAERALAASPALHSAELTLAEVEIAERDHAAAAERLRRLLSELALTPVNRAVSLALLGDALDGQERFSEAFEAYTRSKHELRSLHAARYEAPGVESARNLADRLGRYFGGGSGSSWSARAAPPGSAVARTHVFLVGFPRSGTTLLEQILASHPEVVALEERECLAEAGAPFLSSDEGLDRLARVTAPEAGERRDAYWAEVRRFGVEPQGRVFVDKMPLNSVLLPAAAKLFPEAKVLWARRDPRDVVLSCLRRRFGMTASMYELTTLEGAAAYYDAVMSLNETYARVLDQDRLVLRYEDLVRDFEAETRRICAFLGLEWSETLKAFAQTARRRAVNTPSAPQVAQGLFKEGMGRWRRYTDQLAPVLPTLNAWAARFGYPAD